ncbi:hypothetical protein HDU67_004081 [Dinochytrium kinnereticum]|nr:hypothetical protein HDU67_004081 [Dinochytrium kinnereticum]
MADVRDEKPAHMSKKNKREDASNVSSSKREKKDAKKSASAEKEKRTRKESTAMETPAAVAAAPAPVPSTAVSSTKIAVPILPAEVTLLEGHESEVFVCAWNPKFMLIASGSADGTARIWKVPMEPKEATSEPIVLQHSSPQEGSKDVTTLDWNSNSYIIESLRELFWQLGLTTGKPEFGQKLGTGELRHLMKRHQGPIFSLKWNKKGDLLLSGSMDKTAIIWDAISGESRQQFAFHEAPTLDVDWKDDTTFATCSTDKCIYVCRLGSLEPIRAFSGHESLFQDEVNAIKWDPTGSYLASCADDKTAKVWTLESESALWDFSGHTKEIYSARWSPVQSSSSRRLLATASWDSTIRIWDVTTGSLVFVLEEHSAPIYSVSFSPDGLFLASGGFDQVLNIWRVRDGALLRSYNGTAGIFEVGWGGRGDKVSASFSDGTLREKV